MDRRSELFSEMPNKPEVKHRSRKIQVPRTVKSDAPARTRGVGFGSDGEEPSPAQSSMSLPSLPKTKDTKIEKHEQTDDKLKFATEYKKTLMVEQLLKQQIETKVAEVKNMSQVLQELQAGMSEVLDQAPINGPEPLDGQVGG